MKRSFFTPSTIILASFLAISAMIAMFALETADAGPKSVTTTIYFYACLDNNNVVCQLSFKREEKRDEGWWHRHFGKHPHPTDFVEIEDYKFEWVSSCSGCTGPHFTF